LDDICLAPQGRKVRRANEATHHKMDKTKTKTIQDSESEGEPNVDLRGNKTKGQKVFIRGKWRFIRPKQEIQSTHELKRKIRDAERTLKRTNINATTKLTMERRISALKIELEHILVQKKTLEKRKKNHEKYKFVRFMERQKVTRRIRKVERELKTVEGKEKKALEKEFQQLKINLNYTLHYPEAYKYISLFESTTDALRDVIRGQVAELMEKSDNITAEELEQSVKEKLGDVLHAQHMDEDKPSQILKVDKPRIKQHVEFNQFKQKTESTKLQKKKAADSRPKTFNDDFFLE
jgi:hypothetical protein